MTETPDVALAPREATEVEKYPTGTREADHRGDFDRQDIRLAVVMNGGVSLAVWISGVTLELHHLAMASRWDEPTYCQLLGLLCADARVDVIAGTSAGGLNGAFLALGIARDRDLGLLRDLWREHGSLEKLLRDPLRRNPPSLLMGDDYFLSAVRDALEKTVQQDRKRSSSPLPDRPVELILTGTLWQGRRTSFTDDMGTAITEMDHDATFRFSIDPGENGRPASGSLARDDVLDELAAAARCTSSFPGAFEPHWVQVTDPDAVGDGPWASKAGLANFRESQYVVDGGVLLNKPIRPALEAVYRQTAQFQLRRILTYVVPDPGEPLRPGVGDISTEDHPTPQAREVLLGVLTRLRSTDSVSRELTEIRARTVGAHARRRARDRLAAAMTDVAESLSARAWQGYIEVRIASAATTIGPLLAAGQPNTSGRWSERDLVDTLQRLLQARRDKQQSATDYAPFFIPAGTLEDALGRTAANWDWGATTVQRLGDTTIDVLKRAVWLAPLQSDERQTIVGVRDELRETLDAIRADRRELNDYWSTAPAGLTGGGAPTRAGPIPARLGDALGKATNMAQLEAWLEQVIDGWDREPGPSVRRQRLYEQSLDLAAHLRTCADAIAVVTATSTDDDAVARYRRAIDPDGVESDRLRALHDYLFGRASDDSADRPAPQQVLRRMLQLDVVLLAFAGASQDVEQEVELVQFSARDPDALTGIQLHHFGAFYRSSWRMNDWLHGRMDGAAHIVRMLLSAERLRQRAAALTSKPGQPADQLAAQQALLLEDIHKSAVSTRDPDDQQWLQERWTQVQGDCRDFVQQIMQPAQPETAEHERELLEVCARAITRSIHTSILREELPALAEAIRGEGDDCAETSQAWLASYDASLRPRDGATAQAKLTTDQLWALWQQARQVGREKLRDEVGSDTFARTAAHAATVTASTVGAPSKPRAVAAILGALRGYTLAVWAMVNLLTRRSQFGPRLVQLAVAAGGVLLAAAIFVPAMPLGLTLSGVVLLLAGMSAGALLAQEAGGVGWRLGICAVLAAGALGGYVYWDWTRNGLSGTLLSLLVKVGIGLLVVLLGWFIARAGPRGLRHDRAIGAKAGREAGERAGGEAGELAGGQAGRAAGQQAGREAGERAGRTAGERAGQTIRRREQLRHYQLATAGRAGTASLDAAVRQAAEQAAEKAGRDAGRHAGEQARREAGEGARQPADLEAVKRAAKTGD